MEGRDVLALTRTGPVAEGQQGGGYHQADADDEEAAAEDGFDFVLEEEADDADGYHGDEDVDDVTCALVPLELEEVGEEPHYLFPQDDAGAEDGGHMDGDGEGKVLLAGEAKEVGADGEVATGGDGQILGESLDDTKD